MYARHSVDPKLCEEARESIANAYADLRAKADERTLPVTARCLESLIRLASAHAKVRLSKVVDWRDCRSALRFLSYALYGDAKFDNHLDEGDPVLKPQVSNGNQQVSENVKKRTKVQEDSLDVSQLNHSAKYHFDANLSTRRHILVVESFTRLASIYATQGKVHISELMRLTNSYLSQDDGAFQQIEIERSLLKLQSENRLMYDETNREVHFL